MAIRDARRGLSPIPLAHFPDPDSAREYANAYAKASYRITPRKRKDFFGDPEAYKRPQRGWTEDTMAGPGSHVNDMPGAPTPGNRWI